MTGNFLTSVAGGVSRFLLKWFVGFKTLICKMKSLTVEQMQTLQEAVSSTFRISPFLPDLALLMPVEVLPLISNLIRPEDCGPFFPSSLRAVKTRWHKLCRDCVTGALRATRKSFASKCWRSKFRFGAMSESNKQKLGIGTAEVTAARSRVALIW